MLDDVVGTMYKPDIKAMFHRLNAEHFDNEIPEIPVVWNTRMTTTAGYCRHQRSRVLALMGNRQELTVTKIDLSEKLFRNENYDLVKIERTLIHEMVHAFLVHKYNEKGHTRRFQSIMTRITGEHKNHRCHNYNTDGIRRTRRKQAKNVKWTCDRCEFIGWKARMPRNPGRAYTHNKCGGKVSFIDTSRISTG